MTFFADVDARSLDVRRSSTKTLKLKKPFA